jgi:peroxiredoxin
MRKLIFALVVLLLANAARSQDAPKGLHVNDKAPAFVATDQNGKTISLASLTANGPVVLVFYRGQWCPYCNKQLSHLQDSVGLITGKGATLVAVTPEKPENVQKTIAKTKAGFSILSDEGLKIMKRYDVAYTVQGEMLDKYKKYGIDFMQANGDNGANLPVPTVYIISKSGVITYVNFNPDYTKRPSVAEILAHL